MPEPSRSRRRQARPLARQAAGSFRGGAGGRRGKARRRANLSLRGSPPAAGDHGCKHVRRAQCAARRPRAEANAAGKGNARRQRRRLREPRRQGRRPRRGNRGRRNATASALHRLAMAQRHGCDTSCPCRCSVRLLLLWSGSVLNRVHGSDISSVTDTDSAAIPAKALGKYGVSEKFFADFSG